MNYLCSVLLTGCILLLTGCATGPAQPILLDQATTSLANTKMAVVLNEVPKPNTFFPGAGCLFCIAAAEITNNKLTTFAKALPTIDLSKVKTELTELLRARGISIIELPANFTVDSLPDAGKKDAESAKKDFSSMRTQHKLDKIIVLNFSLIGMQRNYASYIPTGAPVAKVQGLGYLVDIETNKYQWYQPIDIQKGSEGEWDEEPKFPGLTNAYFQAIELSKDVVLTPFKSK